MKKKNYYVYVYFDQRKSGEWTFKNKIFHYQPFYVGKGNGKRDIEHLCPYMLNRNCHKSSTIKSIIKETDELPIHYKVYEDLSNAEAVNIEKEFITKFGRRDVGTGILCNHTDGGEGANNFSLEIRKKMGISKRKIVYQYSLAGKFIKKWNSLSDVGSCGEINECNVSTSIKRMGTCGGYIWSYKWMGKKIKSKIKYQMPIKYRDIIQIDKFNGNVIMEHKSALAAEKELNLRNGARNKIYECISGKLKTAYGFIWKTKI